MRSRSIPGQTRADKPLDHYTLRYLPGTDLRDAKHVHTQVKVQTWVEAEDARLALPANVASLLEVVQR